MTRITFRLSLAICLVVGMGAPALAQSVGQQKLDSVLERQVTSGQSYRTVSVIIRTQPRAESVVQKRLLARGGTVRKQHALIDAFTADVAVGDIPSLAEDPAILSISINALVSAGGSDSGSQQTATLEKLLISNDLRATLGTPADALGVGIGIAIIDSGIAQLDDFVQIVEFRDFTRGGLVTRPYDDYGHGTHVAGLIASTGSLSTMKYVGVAPGVRLIGLKVLDANGSGRTSDVVAALEFATLNRARLGIDVINLSLGHPIYQRAADDPLVHAVEAASRAGIVVVVSAGNYGQNPETREIGYGGITSPGNAPSAITVGASKTADTVTRLDDGVAKYSSRGPTWYDGFAKPDIVAPGEGLVSDVPRLSTLYRKYTALRYDIGKAYFLKLSGSSMATAVTSGVAALVIEANRNARIFDGGVVKPATFGAYLEWAYRDFVRLSTLRPGLTPNAVKAILQYTAIPLERTGEPFDPLTQGTGAVNAEGALRVAAQVNPMKPIGTLWATAPITDRWSFIAGSAHDWSSNVIWNNTRMSGSLFDVYQPAWDFNIVWGTNASCAPGTQVCANLAWGTPSEDLDNIVWGTFSEDLDNIVWGTFSEDLDNIVWGTVAPEDRDNIVWGTNVVWSDLDAWVFNIVWGTNVIAITEDADNIVWGTNEDLDNIVWGTFFTMPDAIMVMSLGRVF